ncbi:hypothetical protein DENSPDRAFT_714550 [Dentipellis sp. KUC8613]|nr:hypothetical protein DENSPDRAFT_714550 [Dentipellis sp. KUC8613]
MPCHCRSHHSSHAVRAAPSSLCAPHVPVTVTLRAFCRVGSLCARPVPFCASPPPPPPACPSGCVWTCKRPPPRAYTPASLCARMPAHPPPPMCPPFCSDSITSEEWAGKQRVLIHL